MAHRLDKYLAKTLARAYAAHNDVAGKFHYAAEVTESLHYSLDQIKSRQLEKIKKTVAYSYDNCKFYNSSFKQAGFHPDDLEELDDISKLPLLNKNDIRNHLSDLKSNEYSESDLQKSATGGSTGIPVTFYRDINCALYHWGIDLALFQYHGWSEGDWQGWLWGASRDVIFPSTWKAKIRKNWIDRVFFLDTAVIDEKAYERFITESKMYNPSFISGYPSVVYDLALQVESGKVNPIRYPMISCTAEQMHDFQRTKINDVLTDRLYERYGSREIGTASFECDAHNGQHLFTDSLYIESIPIEESNGQLNKLVVTDLVNTGMPFIRYDIGDIATITEEPCSCGLQSPRLMNLMGRQVDLLWRPDGSGVAAHLSDVIPASKITASVQIVQEEVNKIILRVEGSLDENCEALEIIKNKLLTKLGEGVSCQFEEVSSIPRTASGKYQYVISKVKRESV